MGVVYQQTTRPGKVKASVFTDDFGLTEVSVLAW